MTNAGVSRDQSSSYSYYHVVMNYRYVQHTARVYSNHVRITQDLRMSNDDAFEQRFEEYLTQ